MVQSKSILYNIILGKIVEQMIMPYIESLNKCIDSLVNNHDTREKTKVVSVEFQWN